MPICGIVNPRWLVMAARVHGVHMARRVHPIAARGTADRIARPFYRGVTMTIKSAAATVFVIACLAVAPAPGAQVSTTPIIIRAAQLIDGRGGPPLAPAMVRVENDRIAEVASSLAIPAGA